MTETNVQLPKAGNLNLRPADPADLQIADITVDAVDQIGATAADQIDQLALQIEDVGKQVGGHLRGLATAIRDRTNVAKGHVAEFVDMAKHVHETAGGLMEKVNGGSHG